jgi:hypothetical protein
MLEGELSLEPEHAVAEASQDPIPASICGAAPFVIAPIHLDDQTGSRSHEVSNKASANDGTKRRSGQCE